MGLFCCNRCSCECVACQVRALAVHVRYQLCPCLPEHSSTGGAAHTAAFIGVQHHVAGCFCVVEICHAMILDKTCCLEAVQYIWPPCKVVGTVAAVVLQVPGTKRKAWLCHQHVSHASAEAVVYSGRAYVVTHFFQFYTLLLSFDGHHICSVHVLGSD
jgi:hypothetical protein